MYSVNAATSLADGLIQALFDDPDFDVSPGDVPYDLYIRLITPRHKWIAFRIHDECGWHYPLSDTHESLKYRIPDHTYMIVQDSLYVFAYFSNKSSHLIKKDFKHTLFDNPWLPEYKRDLREQLVRRGYRAYGHPSGYFTFICDEYHKAHRKIFWA